MVNYFYIEDGLVMKSDSEDFLHPNIIWVDLIKPTADEKEQVEKVFGLELFTKQEREEIEESSKYVETADEIGINLNFLSFRNNEYITEPISFILRGKLLVTQRDSKHRTFDDAYKKLRIFNPEDGDDIFLYLVETRIDFDADLIESITEKISKVSKELIKEKEVDKELLISITSLQETTITIRENIVEKQRVLSAVLKSKIFPKENSEKMRIMIKDVSSLLEHSSFNFERLEFLQNTFLGLLDMEQNRVIKIFTVVTVIFMPPTLIASMYGMNFRYMPELTSSYGYPFAIILMVLSSVLTLLFFKKKKWL
jgi:magnesium transporter